MSQEQAMRCSRLIHPCFPETTSKIICDVEDCGGTAWANLFKKRKESKDIDVSSHDTIYDLRTHIVCYHQELLDRIIPDKVYKTAVRRDEFPELLRQCAHTVNLSKGVHYTCMLGKCRERNELELPVFDVIGSWGVHLHEQHGIIL